MRKTAPKGKRKRQPALQKPRPVQVPDSWGGTVGEWRALKRTEWAVVERAFEKFLWGAAYVPAGDDLYQMQRAVDRMSKAMAEDWIFA